MFVIALLAITIQARDLSVIETRMIETGLDQATFFPRYELDGEHLLFSSAGYAGLWRIHGKSLALEKISSALGSGFEPRSLPDGSLIVREDHYDKGRKFTDLVRYDGSQAFPLIEKGRFLSPVSSAEDALLYLEGSEMRVLNLQSETLEQPSNNMLAVFNDKLSLKLLRQGELHDLQPLGPGSYLWAELSPQADKILFTKVGDATYVCDLEGVILSKIGVARAPHWSPTGEYIVYMIDEDDGSQYLESDIWICTPNADQSWNITGTKDRIELYPQWSPNGSAIVYHTADGKLYETTVEISD